MGVPRCGGRSVLSAFSGLLAIYRLQAGNNFAKHNAPGATMNSPACDEDCPHGTKCLQHLNLPTRLYESTYRKKYYTVLTRRVEIA